MGLRGLAWPFTCLIRLSEISCLFQTQYLTVIGEDSLKCNKCTKLQFIHIVNGNVQKVMHLKQQRRKKHSERRKHCTLAVARQSQKFSPCCAADPLPGGAADPLPGGAGRPKFHQLELEKVTTFTRAFVRCIKLHL